MSCTARAGAGARLAALAPILGLVLGLAVAAPASAGESVVVLAATTLRPALADIASAYEGVSGDSLQISYGPTRTLHDRIAAGDSGAQVLVAVGTAWPAALARAGLAQPPVVFGHEPMCALAARWTNATASSLLDVMLDGRVKLGTSTPKVDPLGDAAWALFARAERSRRDTADRLAAKARQLTGRPGLAGADGAGNPYADHVAAGRADVFLAPCSSARDARQQEPTLLVVDLPSGLQQSLDYAVAVVTPASEAARRFVAWLAGPQARAILARDGLG